MSPNHLNEPESQIVDLEMQSKDHDRLKDIASSIPNSKILIEDENG